MRRYVAGHPRMAAFLGFALVALIAIGPVLGNPRTTWAGYSGDPEKFISFVAWYPHALLEGINPLFNDVMNRPNGVNMMWDTTVPLPAILLTPITLTLGPIAAYNLGLTAAIILNGFCTFLWLQRHVRDRSAFVGALLTMLGPYVAIHAEEHLNLVMIFPIALVFMAVEDLTNPEVGRWRSGVRLGGAMTIALLCAEEIAAIAVMAAGIALCLALATGCIRVTRRNCGRAASVAGVALSTILLLAGFPMWFQFFGPGGLHGPVQPINGAVTDLVNFVVATPLTGPGLLSDPGAFSTWPGNPVEQTAFIGVPLLVIGLVSWLHGRGDPYVRMAGMTIGVLMILSLGPTLHVNGWDTNIPMPALVLAHIPLFENLLPVRLSAAIFLGIAFLAASGLDRWWTQRARLRLVVVGAVTAITLVPQVPFHAQAASVPGYFTSSDSRRDAPNSAVLLVLPVADSATTSAADLWQAMAGFSFAMPEGYVITANGDGRAVAGPRSGPLRLAFDHIRDTGNPPSMDEDSLRAMRTQLRTLGVTRVVLGPTPQQGAYERYVDSVLGADPQRVDGVLVWAT